MIPFQKVWNDSIDMISNDKIEDVNVVETYKGGFVVEENKDMEFVNKDDFVYFWSKMICDNEISAKEVETGRKLKYIYKIVKNLPYISETANVLKIIE